MSSPRIPQSPQVLQFRFSHVLRILHFYYDLPARFTGAIPPFPAATRPLDDVVASHFRRNKALGSKDRAFISDATYEFFRWKSLLEEIEPQKTLLGLLKALVNLRSDLILQGDSRYMAQFRDLPDWTKVACPEPIHRALCDAYGREKANELCLAQNTQAPITARVNLVKTTREELEALLLKKAEKDSRLKVTKTTVSPCGLQFPARFPARDLDEFHGGLFEMQDEASQLVADLVNPTRGHKVLDYCAGAGGKSLAFAHKMQGQGQLFLHDVRPKALQRAKARMSKAGVQNVQFHPAGKPSLELLKGHMDWVIADVPCSGTGTYRRNPDQKWRMTEEQVASLVGQQQEIVREAVQYLGPRGRLVYSTCSILPEENERQVERLVKEHRLRIDGPVFKSLPSVGGMDGMFAVRLVKV